jgi:putative ABC transport system permease protein
MIAGRAGDVDRPGRIRLTRLMDEAVAGVMQRPWRSLLVSLGTALGIGSFVAVIGITGTANSQIDAAFNRLVATEVAVTIDSSSGASATIPADAEGRVTALRGAVAAGAWWAIDGVEASLLPPAWSGDGEGSGRLLAASPGYWAAVEAAPTAGRTFDDALSSEPVAVIGSLVAERWGLGSESLPATVYLDGRAFAVIGIVGGTDRAPTLDASIVVPAPVARERFGEPGMAETLTVRTDLGAAEIVAEQAPYALDAAHPEWFAARTAPAPVVLHDAVSRDLELQFLALAIICLVIGVLGVANSNLMGVMGRVPEIGLRRAVGAGGREIGAQFLLESCLVCIFGSLLGSSLGMAAVILVSVVAGWTPSVPVDVIVVAPVAGVVIGLLAGVYPAVRASRIQPVQAFRAT